MKFIKSNTFQGGSGIYAPSSHRTHGYTRHAYIPTKIPVSPNYQSILQERKARMIEPKKKFSMVSRVSQFNSSEILTNPVSSNASDSHFAPLSPYSLSPTPSELENEILRLNLYPKL